MTQEMKAAQHSQREHKRLLPSVWSITKEVNHKAKRYKKVRDENGVQTMSWLVSKMNKNPK
jgi:hypothetical protein